MCAAFGEAYIDYMLKTSNLAKRLDFSSIPGLLQHQVVFAKSRCNMANFRVLQETDQ